MTESPFIGALKRLEKRGHPVPLSSWITLAKAYKTQDYYNQVLTRMIRSLYNGYMDALEFVQVLDDLISGQLRKAFEEGIAQNGYEQLTVQMEDKLTQIVADEESSIYDFAQDIVKAKADGDLLDPLLSRADLWSNRYQDVANQAVLMSTPSDQNLKWELGETEKHCPTCTALDGMVATSTAWEASGYKPQNPPNDKLDCGGWNCDCRCNPTTDAVNVDGVPSV